jgi:quinohemoprotein ethanol dehydrogenase
MHSCKLNSFWALTLALLLFLMGEPSLSLAAPNDTQGQAGVIGEKRILAEAPSGHDWMVTGANFGQTHFSPLSTITQENVKQLGLAWWLDVDSPMGLAVEPLEA